MPYPDHNDKPAAIKTSAMQSAISNIETIISQAGELVETKAEILKLKAAGKISETVSSLIARFTIVFCIVMAVVILSIGAAIGIGNLLGNTGYGFFIAGGFYLLAGLLLYLFRRTWIKAPLSDLIIHKIMK